ncbi:MAG TPA: aminotransferase class V-fold PLP-dependent enzyme [Gemmatimonadetes bacterium]|jgi:selenocysteine lyase/cysteine desulfurase|nr:aminotransferase class V-fold PLP-dependent enzyme [Gemmatimonadota bacterium]HIC13956.1 aminotransferase class V-fold PLP-dependent enzyme [Gemmatimonadota bacterium]
MNPEVRGLFPGASEHVYLDVSARGLISEPVHAAVERHIHTRMLDGGDKDDLRAEVECARHAFAGLVNASVDEIAITKNVSEGLNLFAASLPWEPEDNVLVCPELEHPNNIYLWFNLARLKGIEVRKFPADEGRMPVAAMADAIDERTRVVTMPSISFSPGFLTDVKGLARAAKQAGALTLIDAAQSIGAIDTDVRDLGIDAFAVATQKCLLSLYGFGFLYVRREVAESLIPVHVARYGIDLGDAHETAFAEDELRYQSGALRFDLGNYNYLGAAAAAAALDLLQAWGMKKVEAHLRGLASELATGLLELGLPVAGGSPGPHLAHIVSVGESGGGRHYSADDPAMNSLHDHLVAAGIRFSIRSGVLRLSIGVYNQTADIEQVIEAARTWTERKGYHG